MSVFLYSYLSERTLTELARKLVSVLFVQYSGANYFWQSNNEAKDYN